MRKAIVIGATSGIGRELSKVLAKNGYAVGITGRRLELLRTLQKEIPTPTFIKQLDLVDPIAAERAVEELIHEMGGMDLMVINAGVGYFNAHFEWEKEKNTIDVNVAGFTAMATLAARYFKKQGSGHIVGISSIAALRGDSYAPAYSASKAYVSNYLVGLRKSFFKKHLPVYVTDIQPGYVDTALVGDTPTFWSAPPEVAAQQIYEAIAARRPQAYITRRWRLIAWLLKIVPDWIYMRV